MRFRFDNHLLRFQSVRDVITAALRCTFGLESSQMSLLLFLTIVKSAGGVNTLMEATEVELTSSIVLYFIKDFFEISGCCSGVRH